MPAVIAFLSYLVPLPEKILHPFPVEYLDKAFHYFCHALPPWQADLLDFYRKAQYILHMR